MLNDLAVLQPLQAFQHVLRVLQRNIRTAHKAETVLKLTAKNEFSLVTQSC